MCVGHGCAVPKLKSFHTKAAASRRTPKGVTFRLPSG